VQGQWLKNGVEIARRAAHCLDLYARYLPGVPYTGDDVREKAARVTTAKEVWAQLDLLARQARDTYLIERAELHAMTAGVRKALEATSSYPFLPEGDRQNIQAGIATLRAELDEKNRKISKTKKAAGKRKAEAREIAQAEIQRLLDIDRDRAEPQATASVEAPARTTVQAAAPARIRGGLRSANQAPRRTPGRHRLTGRGVAARRAIPAADTGGVATPQAATRRT
jgi:hypothetical protein